jgi:hypothetical protein
MLLELRELHADRGGRNEQCLGGLRRAACFDDRAKVANLSQVHKF